MVTEVLVVYLHYAAMTMIAVFLAIEYLTCVPGLAREKVKLLARIDLLYLIAALLAFGEAAFLNGSNSNYGAMFANKITVDCP